MENLKNILNSNILFTEITKIGEKFNLHIDQIGGLDSETRQICLGTKNKDEFAKNIAEHLEVPLDLANEIAQEVNTNIFLKIRELMQGGSTQTQHIETPDEILKHIEDGGLELPAPEPVVEPPKPIEQAVAPAPKIEAPAIESTDLTDHLLKNPIASPHVEESVVKKYTVDPYREPIN